MLEVITIGSATRDNFLEVDLQTVSWPQTPTRKAYALPLGEKLKIKNALFTIGGNAANAAVTFARQGFRTACAAKVGKDIPGEELRRRLAREGVEAGLLNRDSGGTTSYSVLLLKKGERTILNYPGVADSFRLRDLDAGKLKSRWWYVSLAGESDKMFKPLVNLAAKNGTAMAFNPSGHHIGHRRGEILSALARLSFLVLNDEEAALLTGIPWRKEKEVFRKLDKMTSPGILAVTTGPAGATVSDGKYVYKAGIFKEKQLADRTGAGDAFGSGFVAGLMRRGVGFANIGGVKPEDVCYAIRLATANATSVVEKVGATEGILGKSDFNSPRWKNIKITTAKLK